MTTPPGVAMFAFLASLLFSTGSAVAEEIKVAFIGDQGASEGSKRVLELIRDEGTDLLLIQGDLGYDPDTADTWVSNIDTILGKDFPVLIVVGNHENYEWPRYQQWQKDKLDRVSDIRCEGNVGVKAYCTYKNIGVVQVAPGITEVDGIDPTDNYADYITEKLSSDNSTWRICSWHKNMRDMQAGQKGDATGWGVYQNCLAQGGLVMTGHEHSYSRTHLMSDFESKQIIHKDSDMDIGQYSSLAFVSGLGGRQIRPQAHSGDWFASIYTETQNANLGSLFCTFNGDNADCYMKDIAGAVPDTFSLTSKLDGSTEQPTNADTEEGDDSSDEESNEAQAEQERIEAEDTEAEANAQVDVQTAEEEAKVAEEEAEIARLEAEAAEQAEQQATAEAEQARQDAEAAELAQAEAQNAEEAEAAAQNAEQAEADAQEAEQVATEAQANSAAAEENMQAAEAEVEQAQNGVVEASTAATVENPFGVPTSIADDQNAPVVGSASPPPPMTTEIASDNVTDSSVSVSSGGGSGGGIVHWLSLIALAGIGAIRRFSVCRGNRCRTRFCTDVWNRRLREPEPAMPA